MMSVTKVLVVGLDGLEPKIVSEMIEAGALPHLARLRDMGGFGRVATTYPAQTPVAWSTFATGVNPGGHGIFDFIRRDPLTYLPELGLARYEQKNMFVPPKAVNLRRGTPMWEVLADAGVPSSVLRCPCTYPPDKVRGTMLSGLGVPDVRGGLGTSTFYSTDDAVEAGESETVVPLRQQSDQHFHATLVGPRHPKTGDDATVELIAAVEPSSSRVSLRIGGGPTLALAVGEWSDWVKIKFKLGALQSVSGSVRFIVPRVEPHVELYASPINFATHAPMFPISAPWEYAQELEQAIGPYYTTGMVEDHTGLTNGRFDEGAFLDQCAHVMRERERMMLHELERFDRGLFFVLFDTPDRLQHMFWRFGEDDHPANRGRLREEYRAVIRDHYRECDAIVGKALEYVDDETLCIVLSDHGFSSFQRGFDINAWLHQNGFLALKPGTEAGEAAGDFLHAVDWGRTRAYALGFGSVYLNLAGREAEGTVTAADAPVLAARIAEGLAGLTDPERGQVAIRRVVTRDAVYHGPATNDAPDLCVLFEAGYRASWTTPLGGVADTQFEDNVKRWSGDHIIDPDLVPGVLFMNRPFGDGAELADLAPTILGALGVPRHVDMHGKELLT